MEQEGDGLWGQSGLDLQWAICPLACYFTPLTLGLDLANWSGCSEQAFIGSCTEPESQSFLWHPGNAQSCCLLCLVWKPSLSQGQGWTSHLREGVGCETAFILYHLCMYVNTQRHVKPATPIPPKKKVVVEQVSDRKLESWEVVFFSAHLKMWNMNKMPVLCK